MLSMAQQPWWKNDVKCHVIGGSYRRKKCYFDEFSEGGSEFSNFWRRLGARRGIQASMALPWTYPLNSQAGPLRGKKMRPRLAGRNQTVEPGAYILRLHGQYIALARILLNSSQMERVGLQYSVRTPIGRLSRPSFQISTPTSPLPRMKVCDLRLSRHNEVGRRPPSAQIHLAS